MLVVSLAIALLAAPAAASALTLQPGYKLDAPLEDVRRPTAIQFAPAGEQVFVAERNGKVKVFEGIFDPVPELALDITDEVHSIHDRGLLGMALHPEYPAQPYLYLSYPYDAPAGEEAPVHAGGSAGDDSCVLIDGGEQDCLVSGRVSRFELDPVTGTAVTGEEEPLVEDWCQQFPVHSLGDLKFEEIEAEKYALLASGGDGANFVGIDYGQFSEEGSQCPDDPNEGGSLRSQDLGDDDDPIGYNGTVIRIDPETGVALDDNPLYGDADPQTRRIIAYGLRNPFRLALRPGTSQLWIADVGSGYFDEVNRILDPLSQPGGVANFGWPCFEGNEPRPGVPALADDIPLPLCRMLYQSAPGNLTLPYFPYPRTGKLFSDDQCDPSSGAAISGLTFYDVPAAAEPGAPAELQNSLLLADAARGCLWEMPEGKGAPTSKGMRNLVVTEHEEEGAFIPVNITVGPDGAIYMPNFYANEISRLRHFPDNQPPTAEIVADRTFGLMDGEGKFPVEFDASGSTDVDEAGELTYEWDLDGNGEFEPGSATIAHTYEAEENVTAQVRVIDSEGATDFDRVKLYPGDRPPENLVMELPPEEPPLWTVGDKISLKGSATDPDVEDEIGDEIQLDWDVILRHCPDHCHSHPLEHFAGAETAEVTAPDHEYPSHLLVRLTATDNRGLSPPPIERPIHPRSVDMRMESEPPGAKLTIGEATREAPFEWTLLAGGAATVSAPETTLIGGVWHRFSSWSDGGERTHLIRPAESDTLVARYTSLATPLLLPPEPPTLPLARLRFASHPGGLPLRVGRGWQRASFVRSFSNGERVRIEAPKVLRRRGKVFVFSRWKHSARRVNRIAATRPRTYVAIFKSRPIVRDGLVQALSWRRPAR